MSAAPSAEQTARTSILIPRETISITLSQPHDPREFNCPPDGLPLNEWRFRKDVVANAKPVPAGTSYKIAIFELRDSAFDKQIEAALPKHHLLDETAVCAIVAELVGEQPERKRGHLEHTGRANLLYLPSCVAYVCVNNPSDEWVTDIWHRDGAVTWSAGSRVLCPA